MIHQTDPFGSDEAAEAWFKRKPEPPKNSAPRQWWTAPPETQARPPVNMGALIAETTFTTCGEACWEAREDV